MKKDRTKNIEDKEKDEDKTYENETNNDMEARPQLKLFRDLKCDISIISAESDDDITNNLGRKTYLIKCP